jgi:hypothetical protein
MSITTYQPRSDYIGTGLVSTYSFNFKIIDKSQLTVAKANASNVLVWSVQGDDLSYLSNVTFNEDGGGQVTLLAALEVDYKLYIYLSANEPIQTKAFKERSYWTLKQFEDALDYLAIQLQAVAYLAKRAPMLGKLVTQADADAFNTEVALIADSVITVNATADGFEAVPRSAFIGDVGATGATGPAGSNGTNGANGFGIRRAGGEDISNSVSTHTVTFSTPTSDALYIETFNFYNDVDADPILLQGIVTNKTVNGFTIKFNAITDSINYKMRYAIYDAI